MSTLLVKFLQISRAVIYPRFKEFKRHVCETDRSLRADGACANVASPKNIKKFIMDCMKKVKTPLEHAEIFADCLIAADCRESYIKDIKGGSCDPSAVPVIEKESASTALVCGKHGLGAVIGSFAMNLALDKAEKTGIGLVTCNESNNFGAGIVHILDPIEKGYLCGAFSNTPPLLVPTGAKKAALGANPITIGAPGVQDEYVTADLATSVASFGKIEHYKQKKKRIPEGWALDESGDITTDADAAVKAKKLLPLGGNQGYSLSFIVEILCGILSGSAYGPKIRSSNNHKQPGNNGHCFIVVDPKNFEPGFRNRVSDILRALKHLEPVNHRKPVLYPGEVEQDFVEKTKKQGGVIYEKHQVETIAKLANELCVPSLKLKKVRKEKVSRY